MWGEARSPKAWGSGWPGRRLIWCAHSAERREHTSDRSIDVVGAGLNHQPSRPVSRPGKVRTLDPHGVWSPVAGDLIRQGGHTSGPNSVLRSVAPFTIALRRGHESDHYCCPGTSPNSVARGRPGSLRGPYHRAQAMSLGAPAAPPCGSLTVPWSKSVNDSTTELLRFTAFAECSGGPDAGHPGTSADSPEIAVV